MCEMKKIFTIAIFFFIVKIGLSQSFNDSLYRHLYDFQIHNGELKKGDLSPSELKESFYIQELIPNTNTPKFKVYTFFNLKHEEVNIDFLVIEDENYELYDVRSFSVLVNKILDKNFDCSVKMLWIKKILQILDSFKSVNLDNSIVEKNYSGFTYFIPLGNYNNDTEK